MHTDAITDNILPGIGKSCRIMSFTDNGGLAKEPACYAALKWTSIIAKPLERQ